MTDEAEVVDPDADVPFLDDEDSPPGRWSGPDGGGPWEGGWSWRLRRGAAAVTVVHGRWQRITGATLPGGAPAGPLAGAMSNFWGDDLWLAAGHDGRNRVHGRIAATADGVTFTPDAEQPSAVTRWSEDGSPDVRDDLAKAPTFLRRLREDDGFAVATYRAFENATYVPAGSPPGTGPRFSMTFRAAGAFVAEARGLGEEYVDFYDGSHSMVDRTSGRDVELAAEAAAAIARAGWRPYGDLDAEEDRARVATLLTVAAGRPKAARPDQAPKGDGSPEDMDDRDDRDDRDRLDDLARKGRLTREEHLDATRRHFDSTAR